MATLDSAWGDDRVGAAKRPMGLLQVVVAFGREAHHQGLVGGMGCSESSGWRSWSMCAHAEGEHQTAQSPTVVMRCGR